MRYCLISFFASALLLTACQGEKKCRFKPAPIFKQGLPHVSQYSFERKGQQSLESLLLDTGVLLEIGQDICESSRQEYRFIAQGDRRALPDSLWVKEAVRQLVFLSTFSAEQAALKAWADVIESSRNDITLGADYAVQPGISIRVDKIASSDQSTLILLFAQE